MILINPKQENLKVLAEIRLSVSASVVTIRSIFSNALLNEATMALISVADSTHVGAYAFGASPSLGQMHVINISTPLVIRGNSLISDLKLARGGTTNINLAVTLFGNNL